MPVTVSRGVPPRLEMLLHAASDDGSPASSSDFPTESSDQISYGPLNTKPPLLTVPLHYPMDNSGKMKDQAVLQDLTLRGFHSATPMAWTPKVGTPESSAAPPWFDRRPHVAPAAPTQRSMAQIANEAAIAIQGNNGIIDYRLLERVLGDRDLVRLLLQMSLSDGQRRDALPRRVAAISTMRSPPSDPRNDANQLLCAHLILAIVRVGLIG